MTRHLLAVLAAVLSLAASLRLPSAPQPSPAAGSATRARATPTEAAPLLQRRAALGLGVLTAFNAAASAYDTLPEVKMDLADAEKRRKEAEGRIQKNKAEAKPYLAKISTAQKPEDFAAACDAFALYIIGKVTCGSIPLVGIERHGLQTNCLQRGWYSTGNFVRGLKISLANLLECRFTLEGEKPR